MTETERLQKLLAVANDLVRQRALDVIYSSDIKLKFLQFLFPKTASGLAELAQGIIELDTVLTEISKKTIVSDSKKLSKLEVVVKNLLRQDMLNAIYQNKVKCFFMYLLMRRTAQALAQFGITLTRLRDIFYNLPPTYY